MPLYVIGEDGQKYGPASELTIQQWVKESRIAGDTELEDKDTGERKQAREWDFLIEFFSDVPPPVGSTNALVSAPKTSLPSGSYDIKKSLTRSWTLFTANAVVLIVGSLIVAITTQIVGMIAWYIVSWLPQVMIWPARSIGPTVISLGASGFLLTNYYALILDIHRGGTPSLGMLFERTDRIAISLITGLISGVIIGLGFMLCVLPGMLASVALLFTWLFLADGRTTDPATSIKNSLQLVSDNLGRIAPALVLVIALNIAGALLIGIGILISLPVSALILADIYREYHPADTQSTPPAPQADSKDTHQA